MGTWRQAGAVALSSLLLSCNVLPVCAEEVTPAGYHVYDVQESEASDTWYSIGRGVYLMSWLSKLTQGDKGYALCDGYTMAKFDCDTVCLRIYLDQSDDGKTMWHTLDYWTDIAENASVATTESGPYRVARDKYYSVKGAHSVIQDGNAEATTTCTDAVYFD